MTHRRDVHTSLYLLQLEDGPVLTDCELVAKKRSQSSDWSNPLEISARGAQFSYERGRRVEFISSAGVDAEWRLLQRTCAR
jgi:hypothetical protein